MAGAGPRCALTPSMKLTQPVLYACLCLRSDCSLFLLCVFACTCCFRCFDGPGLVLQSRERGEVAHRFVFLCWALCFVICFVSAAAVSVLFHARAHRRSQHRRSGAGGSE